MDAEDGDSTVRPVPETFCPRVVECVRHTRNRSQIVSDMDRAQQVALDASHGMSGWWTHRRSLNWPQLGGIGTRMAGLFSFRPSDGETALPLFLKMTLFGVLGACSNCQRDETDRFDSFSPTARVAWSGAHGPWDNALGRLSSHKSAGSVSQIS